MSLSEQGWLASPELKVMLEFLGSGASDRKMRLFACACVRRIWHLLPDEPERIRVAWSEEYADRLDPRAGLAAPERPAGRNRVCMYAASAAASTTFPQPSTGYAAEMVRFAVRVEHDALAQLTEERAQTDLLRDIVGNPFVRRPVDPAWQTWKGGVIPKLAQAAYDQRALPSGHLDSTRLSVLADALEEAGCTDTDLLVHLRSAGPHVRGCWAVDLLLGKG